MRRPNPLRKELSMEKLLRVPEKMYQQIQSLRKQYGWLDSTYNLHRIFERGLDVLEKKKSDNEKNFFCQNVLQVIRKTPKSVFLKMYLSPEQHWDRYVQVYRAWLPMCKLTINSVFIVGLMNFKKKSK